MFERLFSRKPKNWSQLDSKTQQMVTRKLIKALAGPRYKVVSGWDQYNREQGQIENTVEDQILNSYGRGRMLDMARNQVRNSPTLNSIFKQFDFNTVGVNGGKATLKFDNKELLDAFSKYTRDCDFFDGLNFNTTLKLILKTYILGGDMVILFDDNLVEDSGKLLIYEPDEIGSTTEEAIAKHYGKKATQSLGKVYNRNSRWIGTVVSRSERGKEIFNPDNCYFLRRDPDQSVFDSLWIMPRNVFRFGQGRGISPMASTLANTIDLEDLCNFELQAAKKNSQILAQVLQSSQNGNDTELPSAFDSSTDFESMTDDQIEEAAKQEAGQPSINMTLDKVTAAGCIYQVLPENYKMELLDTKRPNPNMPDFIRFLASRSAAPYGLSQQYATLQASGTDFRAEQVISWPAFQEAQKFLEQICDWTLYRFAVWAEKKNIITPNTLEPDWISHVTWKWPTMQESDEQAHQNAVEKKFQNLTGSYLEEYGSDWKDKLIQIKEEIDFCKANGIPHPAFAMKSGGERTGADSGVEDLKDPKEGIE